WAHYPMIAFATIATVIASQAIISGAYSLTQQAMQLGFLPRMRVLHTASHEKGQIYIPVVNWLLAVGTLAAVLGFGSSDALGGAYGIAVSMLMAVTTVLAALVALKWGYNPYYFRRVMVIASDKASGMAVWRKSLFAMMHLNANLPAAYSEFRPPRSRRLVSRLKFGVDDGAVIS